MFEYHPSYPGNVHFLVPEQTEATVAMRHLWQRIVDSYWKVVREWIAAKMREQEEVIARREAEEKAEREAEEKVEKERLQKIKERKRDEKVARELEGRKWKQSENDDGNPTLKKKKCSQKPKLASTIVESDEGDRGREAKIIVVN
ncbi:hypothetical protein M422DRAFT_775762 [Sphaerobolus stellatus SS14]|nr:hypothetical protein M422DRAFT_775762 [Sphaerobolus stellatus SS14]